MGNGCVMADDVGCITDIHSYLKRISRLKKDYIVIAATKDTLGFALNYKLVVELKKLGIKKILKDKHWRGYLYIRNESNTVAEILASQNESAIYDGCVDEHLISVKSSPYTNENIAKIVIDGTDYAVNKRGVNIVVYNKRENKVLDSVCFDTHSPGLECLRMEDVKLKERLTLINLLPHKIEVRIIFGGEIHLWNVCRSLVEAFDADKRFHVCVVVLEPPNYGTEKDKIELVEREGYEVITFSDEDLQNSDILISMPFDVTPAWMRNKKMAVEIPFALVKKCADIRQHVEGLFQEQNGIEIDYYIFDRLLYEEMADNGIVNEKIVAFGNPKYDGIYSALNTPKEFPEHWGKIKNKRVYLWTTGHVYKSGNMTFDLYAKEIFSYFERHKDCALIFRPHPVYIAELLNNHIWAEEDVGRFRKYFCASDNMVWDEYPDYSLAYSLADAVLLDVNCGILVSALTIKKPMCILRRFDGKESEDYHPNLSEKLHMAHGIEECMDFMDMVRMGRDTKQEMLEEAFGKYIAPFDGKNGRRIKDFITEKYFERYASS